MGFGIIILIACWILLRSFGVIKMPWDDPLSPPQRSSRSKEELERMDEIRSSVGLDPEDRLNNED